MQCSAEAGGQGLQPLPQQNRPASPWLGSGHQLQAVRFSWLYFLQVRAPAVIAGSQASFCLFPGIFSC